MSNVRTYSEQAELALAAYATLSPGLALAAYIAALRNDGRGMSPTQAAEFAERWRVVEQYDGVVSEEIPTYDDGGNLTGYATIQRSTGLSLTLFEEIGSDRQVVAVRGTQLSFPDWIPDLATDIIDILVLGSSEVQAQYAALRDQVARWLAPGGPLQAGFTVTGHSLGGFLAGSLLADFRQQIDHAYLYNAPGVGGATGSLAEAIGLLVGHPVPVVDATKISSLRADAGLSPVAGLGADWAVPIRIHVEDQSPTLTGNHDMRLLTDSLSLYDLIARLDPTFAARGLDGVRLVRPRAAQAAAHPDFRRSRLQPRPADRRALRADHQ